MSDTMSAMSKPQYRPSRRNWVKLWVNEWLTGTMRFQLSQEQRSLWADLLALAGASRVPGIICAGNTNGMLDGYPSDYLCGILRWEVAEFSEALELFKKQGRISMDSAGVIYILNWQKYQSEYHQKRNRAADKATEKSRFAKKSTPKSEFVSGMSAESRSVEVEVDGEVEKKEKKKIQPASLAASEFRLFWQAYPKQIGEQRAREEWRKTGCEGRLGEILASLKDWQKTWTDPQFIPRAARWIGEGLWKENPHVAARKESLHEQLEKLGAKP